MSAAMGERFGLLGLTLLGFVAWLRNLHIHRRGRGFPTRNFAILPRHARPIILGASFRLGASNFRGGRIHTREHVHRDGVGRNEQWRTGGTYPRRVNLQRQPAYQP